MSAKCGTCGEKRNHLIHTRGDHAYVNGSKAGLSPIGRTREAYLASEAHIAAYADARAADMECGQCLAHLAGAPGQCSYDRVPHHIAGRGAFGGQEASERAYPVVMVCSRFNGEVESDPTTRRWSERNTFERQGVIYPFRMRTKARRDETLEVSRDH